MRTKLILDHLLAMVQMEDEEANKYAEGLYLSNKHFANYIDLCYNRLWSSKWFGKKLPTFKCDNVVYGLHFTQLEKVFNKFRSSSFLNEAEETNIPEDRALKMLHQVMEGISDIEQDFLKQLLQGTYKNISLERWKELRRM